MQYDLGGIVQRNTASASLRAQALQRIPYLSHLRFVAPCGNPEGCEAHQPHANEAQKTGGRPILDQCPQGRVAVLVGSDRLQQGYEEEKPRDHCEENRHIEIDVERLYVPVDASWFPAHLDGLAHVESPVPDQTTSEQHHQPRENPPVVESFCGCHTEKANSKCDEQIKHTLATAHQLRSALGSGLRHFLSLMKHQREVDDSRIEAFFLVLTSGIGIGYALLVTIVAGDRTPDDVSQTFVAFATVVALSFFFSSIAHLFAQARRFLNNRKDDDYGWGGFAQIFLADFLFIMACSSIYWTMWLHAPNEHFTNLSSADGCRYVAYRCIGVAQLIAQGVGFGGAAAKSADCEFVAGTFCWFSKIVAATTVSFGIAFVNDHRARRPV